MPDELRLPRPHLDLPRPDTRRRSAPGARSRRNDDRHVRGVAGSTAIGDAIQDLALVQEAGLLVMGAYGHSRMQEFVLGGATSAVLGGARLPVLMSH
jgi:nucleotide-binding universal stress UspA family protein